MTNIEPYPRISLISVKRIRDYSSSFNMRRAAPSRSSYCPDFKLHTNTHSHMQPSRSASGIINIKIFIKNPAAGMN